MTTAAFFGSSNKCFDTKNKTLNFEQCTYAPFSQKKISKQAVSQMAVSQRYHCRHYQKSVHMHQYAQSVLFGSTLFALRTYYRIGTYVLYLSYLITVYLLNLHFVNNALFCMTIVSIIEQNTYCYIHNSILAGILKFTKYVDEKHNFGQRFTIASTAAILTCSQLDSVQFWFCSSRVDLSFHFSPHFHIKLVKRSVIYFLLIPSK